MERPTRAVVVAYSLAVLGVVTMVQYSGVTGEPVISLPSSKAWILSLCMVALGGFLVMLGIAVASRQGEIHRGGEQAPGWLLATALFETMAFAGLLGSALVW
ncbi:hypothetical protein [Haloglomus irregulare]|nr:hypothetical protein [Haloglomus irregulare]